MAGCSAVLAAVMLASLTVPASPITTDVDPKNALVLPGNNITILCRVGKPIYFCRFEIPGETNAVTLMPGKPAKGGISYYGNGFESGQCGLRLENIRSKQNGHLNCTMGVTDETEEAKGTMTLIVAQSPQLPELRVAVGRKGSYVFMEGESLRATCKIAKGRPVARMTWYLGDGPLREGLSRTLLEKDKEGLETITQNVTRTLLWSDNGKQLQCVANHYALTPGSEKSNFQLNVEYAPKPIQHDAAVEEADNGKGNGRIVTLEINANPKPTIRWMAKGKMVREGTSDSNKIFEVDKTINNGTGKWITRLNVHSVDEDILKAEYQVIAENPHGKQTYDVSLTPSFLTPDLEMSSGILIGGVVAVVVLLVILILLCYAWRTKKWCCADPAPCRNEKESESLTASDKEKESQPVGVDSGFLPSNCMVSNGPQFNGRSDTESADGGPLNGPKKKSSFKLPPFFKKKDKVSADPESLTVPSPDKKNVINQVTKSATPNPDGIVYAELDLQAGRRAVVVRPEDDKTEYAEIMHNAKQDEENDHAPQ
ncbi:fasciclin-3 isoform X3 [Ischnura elegans]|uniref:fasciclin-3 isoform X3 n=1 Tax=Ischnura elegans TaxID=197161 RepID=UPI001ED86C91|nr:fasciclin-3 isoform X3 [Ischnura elegans]